MTRIRSVTIQTFIENWITRVKAVSFRLESHWESATMEVPRWPIVQLVNYPSRSFHQLLHFYFISNLNSCPTCQLLRLAEVFLSATYVHFYFIFNGDLRSELWPTYCPTCQLLRLTGNPSLFLHFYFMSTDRNVIKCAIVIINLSSRSFKHAHLKS